MIGWQGFRGNAVRAGLKSTMLMSAPVIAYTASRSQRGDMLADVAAKTVSNVGIPVFTTAIGSMTGNPLLGLALGLLSTQGTERRVYRAVRYFTQWERMSKRLETGGSYQDTEAASRLRLRSMQEMSGALGSARRFLGREAEVFAGQEG